MFAVLRLANYSGTDVGEAEVVGSSVTVSMGVGSGVAEGVADTSGAVASQMPPPIHQPRGIASAIATAPIPSASRRDKPGILFTRQPYVGFELVAVSRHAEARFGQRNDPLTVGTFVGDERAVGEELIRGEEGVL